MKRGIDPHMWIIYWPCGRETERYFASPREAYEFAERVANNPLWQGAMMCNMRTGHQFEIGEFLDEDDFEDEYDV